MVIGLSGVLGKRLKYHSLLSTLTLAVTLSAQDVPFNSPNQSLVITNPSFAGTNGGFRNQTSFASYKPAYSITGNNTVSQSCLDAYVPSLRSGIALTFSDIRATEVYTATAVGLVYAKHIRLGESFRLIPSVSPVVYYQRIAVSLIEHSGFRIARSDSFTNYVDLAAGLLVQAGNRLSIGWACYHFARFPKLTGLFYPPRRITFYGAYNLARARKGLLQLQFITDSPSRTATQYPSMRLGLNAVTISYVQVGFAVDLDDGAVISFGFRSKYASALFVYQPQRYSQASMEFNAGFYVSKPTQQGKVVSFEDL
jgi:hypothetical protein